MLSFQDMEELNDDSNQNQQQQQQVVQQDVQPRPTVASNHNSSQNTQISDTSVLFQKSSQDDFVENNNIENMNYNKSDSEDSADNVPFASIMNNNNNNQTQQQEQMRQQIPDDLLPLTNEQIQISISRLMPGQQIFAIWRDNPDANDNNDDDHNNNNNSQNPMTMNRNTDATSEKYFGVKGWTRWEGVVLTRAVIENTSQQQQQQDRSEAAKNNLMMMMQPNNNNSSANEDDSDEEATQHRLFLEREARNKRYHLTIRWWMRNPHIHEVAASAKKYTTRDGKHRYVIFDFPIEDEHVQYALIEGGEIVDMTLMEKEQKQKKKKKGKKKLVVEGGETSAVGGDGEDGQRQGQQLPLDPARRKKAKKALQEGQKKSNNLFYHEEKPVTATDRKIVQFFDLPPLPVLSNNNNNNTDMMMMMGNNNNNQQQEKRKHKKKEEPVQKLVDIDDVAASFADAVRLMRDGELESLSKWFERAYEITAELHAQQRDLRRCVVKMQKKLERRTLEEEAMLLEVLGEDKQENVASPAKEEEQQHASEKEGASEEPQQQQQQQQQEEVDPKPRFLQVPKPSLFAIAAAFHERNEDSIPFLDVALLASMMPDGEAAERPKQSYQKTAEKYFYQPGSGYVDENNNNNNHNDDDGEDHENGGQMNNVQRRFEMELQQRSEQIQRQQQQMNESRQRKRTKKVSGAVGIKDDQHQNGEDQQQQQNNINEDGAQQHSNQEAPGHKDETSQHSHLSNSAVRQQQQRPEEQQQVVAQPAAAGANNSNGKKPKPKTAVQQTPSIMSFFKKPTAAAAITTVALAAINNNNDDAVAAHATDNNNNNRNDHHEEQHVQPQQSTHFSASRPTGSACALFKHGFLLREGREIPDRLRKLLANQQQPLSVIQQQQHQHQHNNSNDEVVIEDLSKDLIQQIKQNTATTTEFIGQGLTKDLVCTGFFSENYQRVYHRPHYFGTFNRRRIDDGGLISRKEIIRRFVRPTDQQTVEGRTQCFSSSGASGSSSFELLSNALDFEQKRFEAIVTRDPKDGKDKPGEDLYEYNNDSGDDWNDADDDNVDSLRGDDEVSEDEEGDDDDDNMSDFLEQDALALRDKNLTELTPELIGPFSNWSNPSYDHPFREIDSVYLEDKYFKNDVQRMSDVLLCVESATNNQTNYGAKLLKLLGLSIPKPPAPPLVVYENPQQQQNPQQQTSATGEHQQQTLTTSQGGSISGAAADGSSQNNNNNNNNAAPVSSDAANAVDGQQQQQAANNNHKQRAPLIRFGTDQIFLMEEFVRANVRLPKNQLLPLVYEHLGLTTDKESTMKALGNKIMAKFSFSKVTNAWEVKPDRPKTAKTANGANASGGTGAGDDDGEKDEDDVPLFAQFGSAPAAASAASPNINTFNNEDGEAEGQVEVQQNHSEQEQEEPPHQQLEQVETVVASD